MLNIPHRIFLVGYIDNKRYNCPFRTFDQAEQFVFLQYNTFANLMPITDFMRGYCPVVVYNVNPNEPIYIVESNKVITNSLAMFQEEVSRLSPISREKYYGSLYIDFKKVREYPTANEVKRFARKRSQKYKKAYNKYINIIERKIFQKDLIEINNQESVMDFCYNSMIKELDDKFRLKINNDKLKIGWGKLVPYFDYEWPYIDFSQYIPVKYDDENRAGVTGIRNSGTEYFLRETNEIMAVIIEAFDYYVNDNHEVASMILLKLYDVFKELDKEMYSFSLFD